MTTARTLVVVNDYPPRQGGIQSYIYELVRRQPEASVVVYASNEPGAAEFDAAQSVPVLRYPRELMLPTPDVRRRVVGMLREYEANRVWFGSSAPLGLLAPALRQAGAERIVASTHGHEGGWARFPVTRQALRRVGEHSDVITYITQYTRYRIGGAFGPHPELRQLAPGVDVETFRPDVDGGAVRAHYGLRDRPVIVCVSRLVPRKGQDVLIRALPAIRRAVPDVALLIVGRGSYEATLRRLAERHGVAEHVVFAGGVDYADLPAHYAAGDVFAMPCRTRLGGLDVEGLGMVFLEASAVGLPVVVGDSGGAPEAVRDGETGYLVPGRDVGAVTRRLVELLRDPDLRRTMGALGRAWVQKHWTWERLALDLDEMLRGPS